MKINISHLDGCCLILGYGKSTENGSGNKIIINKLNYYSFMNLKYDFQLFHTHGKFQIYFSSS